MKLADRFLIAVLLSISISVSVFCIDLHGDTAVIVDYPGGTANLAGRDFGQPLHEEAKYTFLLEFMNYLENTINTANDQYAVEITGALPSSSHNEIIDFYLIDGKNGDQGVLYRYGSSANYKRAAITIKRTEISQEIVPDVAETSAMEIAPDYRVSKGQIVNVVLISGIVRLEVEGQAMESGSGADLIKVKVRDTGKEFVGSIAGPMEVHIVI